MHLINTKTLELDSFVDHASVAPYAAILSHTWGDAEIILQKWHGQELKAKKNEKALLDGFTNAWVDTTCIDKTRFAELSESINSVYD
ncbi:hypothetical protein LY76DRAFT_582535 [Colletotrichum caudatum]|nr:hypothetical protein LY76DRAFT_582535 [Colletotrichum caudatum]